MYFCGFNGFQNKQRLFIYTVLTFRFLQPRQRVFTARYGLGLKYDRSSSSFKGLKLPHLHTLTTHPDLAPRLKKE